MKILILGGTGFVGRILTENLISSGLSPVLFNRGKRNAGIFPELRKITGDRESDDIRLIGNENWDAVIDFSGLFPDSLELITSILKGKAGRYIFVSSASVYVMEDEAKLKNPLQEDFEVYGCTEEQRKDKDILTTYSQKKAEMERILLASDWLDTIIFRPALMYGRYDPTDRFYYWLYRVKNEKKILIPDNGVTMVTNTYSEDFARLIEKSITIRNHNKIYNAVTHDPVSNNEYINISAGILNTSPELVSAPGDFFVKNQIQPWGDIPMWLGGPDLMLDNTKVKKDFGIEFKSFKSSVQGCIDYYTSLGWPVPKYGISIEKEKELIDVVNK